MTGDTLNGVSEKVQCVWNVLECSGIGFSSVSVSRNALKMPISIYSSMFQPDALFLMWYMNVNGF